MAKNVLLCCFVVLCFVEMFDYAEGECCIAPCRGGYCSDCTLGTPYCANGQCDLIGCNCVDGCRKPLSHPCPHCTNDTISKRDLGATDPQDVLNEIDQNGDGRIDLEETKLWLHRRGLVVENVEEKFREMDRNKDNFITLEELDS